MYRDTGEIKVGVSRYRVSRLWCTGESLQPYHLPIGNCNIGKS